jgi:phytoene dehydrogenase-like protein
LITPFINFISNKGGQIFLRHKVTAVTPTNDGYQVRAYVKGKQAVDFQARFLISGIPINNTLPLFKATTAALQKRLQQWTQRQFGFVGGYPQLMRIKPWQMLDARLDGHRAYICGDTTYPGQGIPGVALSGIIAYEKLKRDWL